MNHAAAVRRGLLWAVAACAFISVLPAAVAVAIDAGFGRQLLIGFFSERIHRPLQVNGAIHAHLFSLEPHLTAEQVVVQNPSWMPAGITAKVGTLALTVQLPTGRHRAGIVSLDVRDASIYLVRDRRGHANWTLRDSPNSTVNERSPILRHLSLPNAHVELNDAQHHLEFVGTVTAQDASAPQTAPPFTLQGTGQLNGRPASFEVTADPLVTASHQTPFHFSFSERSDDSHVAGHGSLPRPFAFDVLDGTFDAAGPDLKDIYFLVGVHLLDTGPYRLSGTFERRQLHTRFTDLDLRTGISDLAGTIQIDSSAERRKLNLDLGANTLRLADFGARAAGRAPAALSPLLLSDAMLSPAVLRGADSVLSFHATQVNLTHTALHGVSLNATIDRNVLTVAGLNAQVLGGRLNAHLVLDANNTTPVANADITVADLKLAQLSHKDADSPPVEGLLQARVTVTGSGSSAHQIAASANGTVRLQVRDGGIRESFAELTGVNLRGLGLLIAGDKAAIPVRCALASFSAHEGILDARTLVVDTEPVLITGEGQIHLDSETVGLTIRGHPKSMRLFRLRAPLSIHGTLAHPALGLEGGKAALIVVDPGKAQNADCAALLAK